MSPELKEKNRADKMYVFSVSNENRYVSFLFSILSEIDFTLLSFISAFRTLTHHHMSQLTYHQRGNEVCVCIFIRWEGPFQGTMCTEVIGKLLKQSDVNFIILSYTISFQILIGFVWDYCWRHRRIWKTKNESCYKEHVQHEHCYSPFLT